MDIREKLLELKEEYLFQANVSCSFEEWVCGKYHMMMCDTCTRFECCDNTNSNKPIPCNGCKKSVDMPGKTCSACCEVEDWEEINDTKFNR